MEPEVFDQVRITIGFERSALHARQLSAVIDQVLLHHIFWNGGVTVLACQGGFGAGDAVASKPKRREVIFLTFIVRASVRS